MEFGRFEPDWTDEALAQLEELRARAPRHAAVVWNTITHYAEKGISPGRATRRPGIYYATARPLPPTGVFYEIVDHHYFRVVSLVDQRRLEAPPYR